MGPMFGPNAIWARLLLATLLLVGGTASAGPGAWTSGGPYGGSVGPLAVDPSNPATLYAGTDSGVFRSTNFGTTWARTSLSNTSIDDLVIDATPAPTIYALSRQTGAFRSTDAGDTWSVVNHPPPVFMGGYKGAYGLAVDPTSPATLYGAFYCDCIPGSTVDLYKSTDSGGTWQARALLNSSYGLAVDPATPSTVFAVGPSQLYRSTDAGATWPALSLPVNFFPRVLALDLLTPGTLYVGSLAGQGSNRLIKSTDAGNSFAPAGAGLPNTDMHALVVDPTTPSRLYASTDSGAFESTDSGATWSATSLASPTNVVAIDPLTTATLYATTNVADIGQGILKSTDTGATWAAATVGVTDADILSLAIRAAAPAAIYAGTKGQGLFKSTDSGGTWALALGPSASFTNVDAVAIDPSNPAIVYAGAGGVRKSTDSGATWAAPTGSIHVNALAIDPLTPTTLYAGGQTPIQKSTDGGVTWSPSAAASTTALAIDPSTPSTVYAGANGVLKTTNAGFTWSSSSAGMGTHAGVVALALDPVTPTTLYAAGVDSEVYPTGVVFKSTDAGATWAPSNAGISTSVVIHTLVIDPDDPSTLYAAGNNTNLEPFVRSGRVFKSTNGGVRWTSVKRGLPETASIDSLALDPSGATTLFAGLRTGSVWQAGPPPTFTKGDMDGDGRADLVFRSNVNGAQNKVWFMDGVTRAAEADITPDAQSADWKIRGVDDFNADARNDLVTWNQVTGNVEFWLMNGTARTGAPVPLSGAPVLNTGWDLSATADFNFDGLPDLVWRNFTSQKIVIWTMNGTAKGGAIIPMPDQAVNSNWIIVAALDYNHDVNPDFLWYNLDSGKLVTWYMDASVVRTTGQFTTPDAAGNNNWKVLASNDYSAEYVPGTPPLDSPDIVWRNETSGNQVVWHLDFTSTRVYGQFTNPAANAPALDWTIVGPR